MKQIFRSVFLVVLIGLFIKVLAQDGRATSGHGPSSWKQSFASLVAFDDFDPGRLGIYIPPNDDAQGGRAGGELRGGPEDDCHSSQAILSVLAPDDSGWTSQSQPTLFWYFSGSACLYPVHLTVSNPEKMEDIINVTISDSITPGIHRLELGDFNFHLSPNVSYVWNISLVRKEKKRLRNLVSGGTLKYVPPSEAFSANVSLHQGPQAIYDYARAGYWYDAFRLMSNMVEATPENQLYRKQRICFIEQVGMSTVAQLLLEEEGLDKDAVFNLSQCHQPPPEPSQS